MLRHLQGEPSSIIISHFMHFNRMLWINKQIKGANVCLKIIICQRFTNFHKSSIMPYGGRTYNLSLFQSFLKNSKNAVCIKSSTSSLDILRFLFLAIERMVFVTTGVYLFTKGPASCFFIHCFNSAMSASFLLVLIDVS